MAAASTPQQSKTFEQLAEKAQKEIGEAKVAAKNLAEAKEPPAPKEPAKAQATGKKVCTHCGGTGEIMHGGIVKCPWCSGGPKEFKGSE